MIKHYYLYAGLAVVNVALAQLNQELGSKAVPIPPGLEWLVPIASVVIVAASSLLPSLRDVGRLPPPGTPPAAK